MNGVPTYLLFEGKRKIFQKIELRSRFYDGASRSKVTRAVNFWRGAGRPSPALFEPGGDGFLLPDFVQLLAFADEGGFIAVHQDLGGLRARIVVRGHHESIRA